MAPDVSIVVLNYNTREELRSCLQAVAREGSTDLAGQDGRLSAELWVVDNASSDRSAEMVEEQFPWARLVRSPRNGGFAFGNNLVLPRTSGRYVLLLNPDTSPDPGAIGTLVEDLERHPEAAASGPKLLRPDGTIHLACRRSFPTPPVAFYRLTGLSRRFPRSRRFGRYNLTFLDPDLATEVDSVCGACMLVRREAIDQVGLLDERFFMYGEDLDWCLRMQRAGWRVRYQPGAVVRHLHGGASRRRVWRTTFHFYRAMDLFYRKHYIGEYPLGVSVGVLAGVYLGLAAAFVRTLLTPPRSRRIRV